MSLIERLVRSATRKLGTKLRRKKLALKFKTSAPVASKSIQVTDGGRQVNLILVLEDDPHTVQINDSTSKKGETLVMKPCSVRLERIKLPSEAATPPALEEPMQNALECEKEPEVPSPQEQNIIESEEEDMVIGYF